MVIWGTDVVVVECREKFMKFITEYICSEFDPEGIYFYVNKVYSIKNMIEIQ